MDLSLLWIPPYEFGKLLAELAYFNKKPLKGYGSLLKVKAA